MISLFVVLTPIALIYSIAILPSGIASIAAATDTENPNLTAAAFIAGKFVPSVIFGLLIVIGLDAVFDRMTRWAFYTWRNPNTPVVVLQLVIGAVMVLFGYRFSNVKSASESNEPAIQMTPVTAFTIGAGLTVVGLPGNVLYFAAIDQILRADLAIRGIVVAIVYYNIVVLSPLVLVALSRWLFRTRADPLIRIIVEFFRRWGKQLLFYGILGLGVLLVVDAVGWFAGFPVLPSYIR